MKHFTSSFLVHLEQRSSAKTAIISLRNSLKSMSRIGWLILVGLLKVQAVDNISKLVPGAIINSDSGVVLSRKFIFAVTNQDSTFKVTYTFSRFVSIVHRTMYEIKYSLVLLAIPAIFQIFH